VIPGTRQRIAFARQAVRALHAVNPLSAADYTDQLGRHAESIAAAARRAHAAGLTGRGVALDRLAHAKRAEADAARAALNLAAAS
jgi:hypothetical protein